MKVNILTFVLILQFFTAFAQNDLKARIEYEAAEEAFAASDYQTAFTHLLEAEQLLGKWTPKVGYLIIISLNNILDYKTPDTKQLEVLNSQIKQYIKYASKSENIDVEKFKEIHTLDKEVNNLVAIEDSKNDPDYQKAKGYFLKKDYEEFVRSLKISAKKNNILAIYELAKAYHEGRGLPRDSTFAFHGYKKAAESGLLEAMVDLGNCYHYGIGILPNNKEALKWYQKAIAKNYSQTYLNLANLYYDQKDYNEAFRWYQKAGDKGISEAFCMLGMIYESGYIEGKKTREAMVEYRKAADLDNGLAMKFIGDLYWNGQGIERDHTQAIDWYQKAEIKKNIQAIEKIGDIYEMFHPNIQKNLKGEIKGASRVIESFNIAIEKYKYAAELGSPSAMFKLGTKYRFYGIVSYESAVQWIDEALKHGYQPTPYEYSMIGDRIQDYKIKLEWYKKSFNTGNNDVKWKISEIYRKGLGGIEKDKKLAKEWRNK